MKPKPLTVASVLKSLKNIAMTSGNEAMKRKKDQIKAMLVAAQVRARLAWPRLTSPRLASPRLA